MVLIAAPDCPVSVRTGLAQHAYSEGWGQVTIAEVWGSGISGVP